jgi:protein-S-isoprenylcysteine O-methyltransferase Ste14
MTADDTAGIAIPPPLVYLAFFLIGVGINEWRPIDLLPSLEQHLIGGLVIVASAAIAMPAARAFRRARTPIVPHKPTTALVTDGIYGCTRNPLYAGLTLLHAGIAVTIDNLWAFVLVVPAVAVIDRYVIAREERFLERKFGADYLAYKARVRRWI